MPHEAHVRAQYDRTARAYDRCWDHYVSATHDLLLARLAHYDAERVLDVGCGTGTLEQRLAAAQPDWKLTGADLSQAMLAQARQKHYDAPDVTFVQASAADLPFPDAHFDLVVSASALHYFPAPETALREIRRVLRPHGTLVLLDWCRDRFPMSLLDTILRHLDPAHRCTFTQAELRRLLVEAGFRVRRLTTHRRLLVWGLMVAEATPVRNTSGISR